MSYEDHDAERAARLHDGRAWDDFCDTLKAAGRVALRETADEDPVDRSEGFRYITRILMIAAMRSIERRTPGTKEQFIGLIPPPFKGGIGVQSPNQDHIVQPIDPRYRYRIKGTVGTTYTHLSAWSPPVPENVGAFDSGLDAESFVDEFNPNRAATPYTAVLGSLAADDGTVDFILSVDDPGEGEVWMEMSPATRELMGRVVWEDRSAQTPPRLTIRCLDEYEQPDPPTPADMAARLANGGQLLFGMVSDYAGWTRELRTRENELGRTDEWYERIGGSPDDRHFEFGYYRVPAGQALVVEFDEPETQHWNFQLCNHWMENLADYSLGEGYVDKENAVRDGSHVRIVVSHDDPGVPNWIEPAGRDHGVMGLRFVQPATPPVVSTRLVPVSDVG